MGTFFHPITLIGESGQSETTNALVDNGSSFTTMPRPLLESLSVSPFARTRLRLANGQSTEADIGETLAQINDLAPRTVLCVFGERDVPPILGAHALEALLLGVDPDQRGLVPLEAW